MLTFFISYWNSELMLLGFISLLLTATATTISNICIPSRFFDGAFAPCSRSDIDEAAENKISQGRELWNATPHTSRRLMNVLNENKCPEACASSSLCNPILDLSSVILASLASSSLLSLFRIIELLLLLCIANPSMRWAHVVFFFETVFVWAID